ncbi:MAG TPA: dihydrodipicolinate reductase C-terminal domain-containing protein [Sphingomicrobium sp.]|nr:dihydrodipicolinate reductase C-terminal domain-containing protein [Sphingomicrobium sp.]
MRTADQPIRISLTAPNGRMGKAIASAIDGDPAFAIDQDHGDVLVDFSVPAALPESLDRAISGGVPVLIGTTGLDAGADGQIAEAAKSVAVLRAANTSLGIALLAELVERAARALGPGWDIQIAEAHHRGKVDAPSGTALMLGKIAQSGGRDVAYASVRGGTVAGDHDVMFLGPDERLILSHRAENRMIFARGALAAARFLAGKPAGLYSMRDVVGSL